MNLIELLQYQKLKFNINIDFKYGHISLINCKKIPECLLSYISKYEYKNNFCNLFLTETTFIDLNKTWKLDTKSKKIHIEYGSFNPTSLPHLGNLRNLFLGLMLCKSLEVSNNYVVSEFYVNDLGKQISKLKEYTQIIKILKQKKLECNISNVLELIKTELSNINIYFDNWKLESSLYDNFISWNEYKNIFPIKKDFDNRLMCFEKYLQKQDKTTTYAASDLLYLLYKQKLNCDKYFLFLGEDNKSEKEFIQKAAAQINLPLKIIEHNSVLLNGKVLSKRSNNIIYLNFVKYPIHILYLFFNSFNLNTKIDVYNINESLDAFLKKKLINKKYNQKQVTLMMYKLKLCLENIEEKVNLSELTKLLTAFYNLETDNELYTQNKEIIYKLIYV